MTEEQKRLLAFIMGLNAGVHKHLSEDVPQTPLVQAALDHVASAHTLLNTELNMEIEPE